MSYFDPASIQQVHLTAGAVEWLRATSWRVTLSWRDWPYVCWGGGFKDGPYEGLELPFETFHRKALACDRCRSTGRILHNKWNEDRWNFDEDVRLFDRRVGEFKERDKRVRTLMFCPRCRGHGTQFVGTRAEFLSEKSCDVADVRAIVRGMTGGSSKKYEGGAWRGFGEDDVINMPTCSVCATLLDYELSRTQQRYPGYFKATGENPMDLCVAEKLIAAFEPKSDAPPTPPVRHRRPTAVITTALDDE